MSDELFLEALENVYKLPSNIYKKMGPFGRVVTMPLWIVFAPLLALSSLMGGFVSLLLLLPLWLLFFVLTPLFGWVILVEHALHDLAQSCLGTDIRWIRKRTLEEKKRSPKQAS